MTILGIETSCDETALALIETRGQGVDFECRVIASLIHSQAELHSAYGGVFPTLAKREHGKNIIPLFEKLASESGLQSDEVVENYEAILNSFKEEFEAKDPDLFAAMKDVGFLKNKIRIDRIAVTEGPGLEPTLWVGINFARILGKLWNIPVVPVNHMEGHVVASLLKSDTPHGAWQSLHELPLPAIALLISGGHTELIKIRALGSYELVGQTRDDAVGEAFDKAARLLGLPYPGGPHISKLAHEAEEHKISSPVTLPRPMIHSSDLNFSFSGLKTAVLYVVRDLTKDGTELSDEAKKGLALEFEMAVTETLASKLKTAIEKIGAASVIIGGGVSANRRLREAFQKLVLEYGIPLFLPSTHTSGDNALMIALAGALENNPERLGGGHTLTAEGTKRLAV